MNILSVSAMYFALFGTADAYSVNDPNSSGLELCFNLRHGAFTNQNSWSGCHFFVSQAGVGIIGSDRGLYNHEADFSSPENCIELDCNFKEWKDIFVWTSCDDSLWFDELSIEKIGAPMDYPSRKTYSAKKPVCMSTGRKEYGTKCSQAVVLNGLNHKKSRMRTKRGTGPTGGPLRGRRSLSPVDDMTDYYMGLLQQCEREFDSEMMCAPMARIATDVLDNNLSNMNLDNVEMVGDEDMENLEDEFDWIESENLLTGTDVGRRLMHDRIVPASDAFRKF